MSVNDWLKQMALAGFTGEFKASNGNMVVEGILDNGKMIIKQVTHE